MAEGKPSFQNALAQLSFTSQHLLYSLDKIGVRSIRVGSSLLDELLNAVEYIGVYDRGKCLRICNPKIAFDRSAMGTQLLRRLPVGIASSIFFIRQDAIDR